MTGPEPIPPWYADGLHFACTRCGHCCSGSAGYAYVTDAESRQIAAHLHLPLEEFLLRHTCRVGRRRSLRERRDGDCEFLVREPSHLTTCSIHAVRPVQCRTWPFWSSNLQSPAAWQNTAQHCPGINHGPHHPLPVIQAALTANGDLPL